jgi:uncharacterized protein (DUF3084 family)
VIDDNITMADPAYEADLNLRIGVYMERTKKELQALAVKKCLYLKSTMTKAEICSLLAEYDIKWEERQRHQDALDAECDARDAAREEAKKAREEAKKAREERLIAQEAAAKAHIAFIADARARIKDADDEIKKLAQSDKVTDDVQSLQAEVERLRKAFNLRTRMYNTLVEMAAADEKYKRDTLQNVIAGINHT